MNVSYFLIKEMIEAKKLRYLSVLVKLKSVYVSGCVHDYSPSKLAKSSDLSRNSIKKYIDYYLSNGFARMEGDNLIFNKFKNVESKYKHATISVDLTLPLKKIEHLFSLEIIKDKVRKFKHKQKAKKDSSNPMGRNALKDLKKAKKAIKGFKCDSSALPNADASYVVSIKKIAEHFNCSVGKAQGIINSLCEDNLLKRITNYKIIGSESRSKKLNYYYKSNMLSEDKRRWMSGGIMLQRMTNSYIL